MEMEHDWWKNTIASDIYSTFKQKELEIPTFRRMSPQLCSRRHLVDWLAVIVEKKGICETSKHLAVYLLDYFMDSYDIVHNQIYLLALVCLLIAVKFEHCDKVPSLQSLSPFIPRNNGVVIPHYTYDEFLSMELFVLKHFNWNISVPSCAHFLPYFLTVCADEGDLHNGIPIISKTVVSSYIEKHTKYFQEISLQDYLYREYRPSLVAAACVAASRICLRITPTWPKQLILMTDYYLEELLPCISMMLRTQQLDARQNMRESPDIHSSFKLPYSNVTPYAPELCKPVLYTYTPIYSVQPEVYLERRVS